MSGTAWAVEGAVAVVVLLLVVWRLRRPHVVVRRTEEHLELWLRRGWRATLQGGHRLDAPLVSRLAYTDGFFVYGAPQGARVLFIGVGAGIGPRQLRAMDPGARVTLVDVSAEVLEVARRHFGVEAEGVVADGREVLAGEGEWDLIVLDAFDAGVFPARLATVEAFASCRARLAADGMLVVNLGGTLAGPLARVWAALVEVFGAERTRAYGVPVEGVYDVGRAGNTIAWAFRGAVPERAATWPAFLPHVGEIAATPVTPPAAKALRDADAPRELAIR